jgi:diadenosine tetraphosphate (Ap4A) HIT family hydrolase
LAGGDASIGPIADADCALCQGPDRDHELDRVEVWRDDLWRLTMSRRGSTLGFAYLEPIRHIPYLADLDGQEAATFGTAIARASRVLREASGAKLVYAYVYGGGIPHLHVHLAPNAPEGVLNTAIVEGRTEERKLPSGATEITSLDHPELPQEELAGVIERVRARMSASAKTEG